MNVVLDLLIVRPHLWQKAAMASMAIWRFWHISLRFEELYRMPKLSAERARRICSGMCLAMSLKNMIKSVADMQLP